MIETTIIEDPIIKDEFAKDPIIEIFLIYDLVFSQHPMVEIAHHFDRFDPIAELKPKIKIQDQIVDKIFDHSSLRFDILQDKARLGCNINYPRLNGGG